MDRVTIPENRFLTQIQFFKTIEFQSTQLCSPFLLRRFSSNLKVIERRGDGKTTTVNTSNYDVSDGNHNDENGQHTVTEKSRSIIYFVLYRHAFSNQSETESRQSNRRKKWQ